jgi:hypothetical protein
MRDIKDQIGYAYGFYIETSLHPDLNLLKLQKQNDDFIYLRMKERDLNIVMQSELV